MLLCNRHCRTRFIGRVNLGICLGLLPRPDPVGTPHNDPSGVSITCIVLRARTCCRPGAERLTMDHHQIDQTLRDIVHDIVGDSIGCL